MCVHIDKCTCIVDAYVCTVFLEKKNNLMLIFQFGTVLYKCLLFWNILRWNLIEPFLMRGLHACMLFECCSCDRLRGNMVTGPREKIDMNLPSNSSLQDVFFYYC